MKERAHPRFAIVMMSSVALILTAGCGGKSHLQTLREKRIQDSPQFEDGEFENPIYAPVMADGMTGDYMQRAYFCSRVDPEPTGEVPVMKLEREDWIDMSKSDLQFAWLGHSSFLVAMDGKTILVDPVLEERASPFTWVGPKRFHPPPVTAGALPPIDVVLITHDHYDHLEEPTIRQLEPKTGLYLVPLGIGEVLEDWDIPASKIVELDWWESHQVDSIRFVATPAVHYARRGLFDGDERLWCSWSVLGQNRKFFVSGDSGYFDAFKKVGQELGPFDLTFLKIGSYDETWKQIHMTPEAAVQQHLDLRGHILVPLHWATFDMALHPWTEPIERMLAEANKRDVGYVTPRIGQLLYLDKLPGNEPWWRSVDRQSPEN